MRLFGDGSSSDRDKGKRAALTAVDAGYTLFDHADIYAAGKCEQLFGELLRESPGLREQLVIASKCGIRFAGDPAADDPGRYDFSRDYIVQSAERSLRRLGIDQLDLFMLHRPDYLMRPQEVAAAFDSLSSAGKVRLFGVSNFSTAQVSLLQATINQPLQANQVEINLHNIDVLGNGVLEQAMLQPMTVQAWCPVAAIAYPAWGNTFSPDDERRLRSEVNRQAADYGVADWQIALAWLLRLPANVMPLIGSTNPARIGAATAALNIDYTRESWYRLLEARNGHPVA